MCEYSNATKEQSSADEPKKFKHKDGEIYLLRGYTGILFQGTYYTLVAYSPADENMSHQVYFRTEGHFASSFKEIKEEYEYQWLLKDRTSYGFYSNLAFFGHYETEEYAQQRWEDSAGLDYLLDHNQWCLIKIEESKRLRSIK